MWSNDPADVPRVFLHKIPITSSPCSTITYNNYNYRTLKQVKTYHYIVSKLKNYNTLKIYISIMTIFQWFRNTVALTLVSPGEIHLNGPSSSSSGCVECVRIMFTFPGMMRENTCFPGKPNFTHIICSSMLHRSHSFTTKML